MTYTTMNKATYNRGLVVLADTDNHIFSMNESHPYCFGFQHLSYPRGAFLCTLPTHEQKGIRHENNPRSRNLCNYFQHKYNRTQY